MLEVLCESNLGLPVYKGAFIATCKSRHCLAKVLQKTRKLGEGGFSYTNKSHFRVSRHLAKATQRKLIAEFKLDSPTIFYS